jgi:hypothetical protein
MPDVVSLAAVLHHPGRYGGILIGSLVVVKDDSIVSHVSLKREDGFEPPTSSGCNRGTLPTELLTQMVRTTRLELIPKVSGTPMLRPLHHVLMGILEVESNHAY